MTFHKLLDTNITSTDTIKRVKPVRVQANVSVNFIFLIVGLLVSSALPPLAFLLTWSKVPKGAAIAGAIGGQAAAIIAWLVHTKIVYQDVNLTTSQVRHPLNA